jgi:hypothetical protein
MRLFTNPTLRRGDVRKSVDQFDRAFEMGLLLLMSNCQMPIDGRPGNDAMIAQAPHRAVAKSA